METIRGHAKKDVENNDDNGNDSRHRRTRPKLLAAQGSG